MQTCPELKPVPTLKLSPATVGRCSRAVDKLFSGWISDQTPGYAAGVSIDGVTVHRRGYGVASLETGELNIPETLFDAGSVAKQFTAAAILLLERDGLLPVEDLLEKHIPELREVAENVTIRHLLHHTSGIRDYLTLLQLAGTQTRRLSEPDLIRLVASQRELNFPPGSDHLYSNTGYVLLALVVRRVSGRSLQEFVRDRLFEPLAMHATLFRGDEPFDRPRASGYEASKSGARRVDWHSGVVGDGGLWTSIDDLLRWQSLFSQPASDWQRELASRLTAPGRLDDGTPLTYACGLELDQHRGLNAIRHSGSTPGFRADVMRIPDLELSVICLTNLGWEEPIRRSGQIADLYLEALGHEAWKTTLPAPVSPASPEVEVHEIAGLYHDLLRRVYYRVDLEGGTLIYRETDTNVATLHRTGPRTFRLSGIAAEIEVTFIPAEPGCPARLRVVRGGDYFICEKVGWTGDSTSALSQFAGEFASEELGVTYHFLQANDRVAMRIAGGELIALERAGDDTFAAGGINFVFQRDDGGAPSTVTLQTERVRRLVLDRVVT